MTKKGMTGYRWLRPAVMAMLSTPAMALLSAPGTAMLWVPGAAMLAMAGPAHAQAQKKPPYWVSLAKDEARMRVGPSMDYPANWIYRRRNLPMRVVETYPNWRKVEDPDGTKGWMHVRLLKDDHTAIVVGDVALLRDAPSDSAPTLYRAEPGVVGRTSDCDEHWCRFDVNGQRGYVQKRSLWGATSD